MCQVSLYPVPSLRRWENLHGGSLLRCGTALTGAADERVANQVVNT